MKKPVFSFLNNSSGIVDVFMNRPDKYGAALSMAQEILREDSFLTPVEREIIAAYTSKLNNCLYCFGSHSEFAKSLGADEDTINKILVEENYSSHYLNTILLYVKKLTLNPSSISSEDMEKVISSGFSEEQLKDAIAVCSIFNFYNRIVEGHGILENKESWKNAVVMVNNHGYDRRY